MSFKPISDIGEFGLIERMRAIVSPTIEHLPRLLQGIGDDCSVLERGDGMVEVATTDLLAENVHFDLLTTPLQHLGSKAISVNISDICAMNAKPLYALVSLALPAKTSVELVETLYRGMSETAGLYATAIAGGDTSSSKSGIVISVTVVGEAEKEKLALRKGAEPGDLVCVTGSLGGAAAGLRVLMRERNIMVEHLRHGEAFDRDVLGNLSDYSQAIERQLLPAARTDIVAFLNRKGIVPKAMIDISDGLAADLMHLCERSGVGARIEEGRVPVLPQARHIADEFQEDAVNYALSGGEDYQLLFAIGSERFADIAEHPDINVIGKIVAKEEGVVMSDIYGMTIDLRTIGGFNHFRQD